MTSSLRLWRPRELPGVEVVSADTAAYDTPRQLMNSGYSIKVTVDGTPPPARYRGREQPPCSVGTVSVVEPDELLQSDSSPVTASFRLLVVEPDTLMAAADLHHRPRFREMHHPDPGLHRDLAAMHRDLVAGADQLSLQCEFTQAMASLVRRHADARTPRRPAAPPMLRPPTLRRVRDVLHDRLEVNVSLDELAGVAGCGKHHLIRSFRHAYGAPPHTYRTLLRLARARTMLAGGHDAAEVAAELGYCDQSQLNRHFRRVLGTSAGQYARAVR